METSKSISKSLSKGSKSNSGSKGSKSNSGSKGSKSKSNSSRSKSKSSSKFEASAATVSIQDIDLKMPEILPGKLNYSEKIAKKMAKTFQMHKHVQPFTGCFYLTNLFYLYLFKKYRMGCIIINYSNGIELLFNFKNKEPIEVHDDNIEVNGQKIFDCIIRGEQIIIIPFMFQITINQKQVGSHANLLIYRAKTGELEHFEPHGAEYGGIKKTLVNESINAVLLNLVEVINNKIMDENVENEDSEDSEGSEGIPEIRLIKAYDVCPVIAGGLQALEQASTIPKNALIEPGGYCNAWSMFFAELCLKNPEIPSRQIYDAIMEKTELYDNKNDYLRNVILGYTCFINNKIAKHFSHIFDEPVSSVKIHRMIGEYSKSKVLNEEITNYGDKFLEIMEVETDRPNIKTNEYPDVKDRYNEFMQGIHSDTSSSSLNSEERISPPRKTDEGVFAKGKKSKKSNKIKGKGVTSKKVKRKRGNK
jgi:hypothetical protein